MKTLAVPKRPVGHNQRVPDPSLAEIAERCREIQAAWTDGERLRRAGVPEPSWRPPVVPVPRGKVEV